MSAYYNEIDPFAAAWLRELITAGLIADGEVDERSIADVRADDLRGFSQCHFFAGIGGWSYALRLAGWPDDESVWTGSCPCQPFSQAGRGAATADPRHLWPSWFRLIAERRPHIVFGEQVASADGVAWLDVVFDNLEGEGYAILWVTAPGPTPTCATDTGGLSLSKWGGSGARARMKRYLLHSEIYGRLNPDLPRWLMGYPPRWQEAAAMVTQTPSCRTSPPRSLKPIER
jgi:hypothetical protein